MGLTNEDVERILRIIDESGYDEISIEHGGLKLYMRRRTTDAAASSSGSTLPTPAQHAETSDLPAPLSRSLEVAPAAARAGAASDEIPEGLIAVRAPMLGTFYRAPSPGAPPFVEEGAIVHADDTVCLIEVMKLFNTLKAGASGRVARFLVENGAMVEYDQPLVLIDPKDHG
jgi:acetyl-CoA carboxylase biotin carboxyl carrier protein